MSLHRIAWARACWVALASLALAAVANPAKAQTMPELPPGFHLGASAASVDGAWWLAADRLAPRLLLFDAERRLHRQWAVATLDGKTRSPVSALRHNPARRSFVVTLRDLAELWEISLDPNAEPIFDGLVHDYRMAEAIASPGYLGVRRAPLEQPLADFMLDPTGRLVIGVPKYANAEVGASAFPSRELWVIHLDARRRIARVALAGPPDLARAVTFSVCNRGVLEVPIGLEGGAGSVQQFDLATWQPIDPPLWPGANANCQPAIQPPG